MASKLVKGSAIILIGNIIFRIGGYVQRFIMATLLGPAAYGIWGLTTPFQGIFQTLSAAGLPPAIAKYISEYTALEEEDLARQTIFTALKIMLFLGIFFGFVMVFIAAPIFTDFFRKPEALLPLRAVGLMTPFSVIVGAFRGAFQGVYKMEYILYTRAIEQIVMILAGTALVLLGLSTLGAVLGTVLGFAVAAVSAIYIFKRYMNKYIAPKNPNFDFPLKAELKLAGRLVKFAIPVSITGLAEMGIYSICTNSSSCFRSICIRRQKTTSKICQRRIQIWNGACDSNVCWNSRLCKGDTWPCILYQRSIHERRNSSFHSGNWNDILFNLFNQRKHTAGNWKP